MSASDIIKEGISIVGVILAAFSGFLLKIAPPDNAEAQFPVGFSSLMLLVIYLLLRLLSHYTWSDQTKLRIWTALTIVSFVVFLITAPIYYRDFSRLVYKHKDGKLFVKGEHLTEDARNQKNAIEESEMRTISDQRLMEAMVNPHIPGKLEEVWTPASILAAKSRLTFVYILVVVSVGCAILSATARWVSV